MDLFVLLSLLCVEKWIISEYQRDLRETNFQITSIKFPLFTHRSVAGVENSSRELDKNVSEVIRSGLRLLETEERKAAALKNAIQEGIDSGEVPDFDPEKNLRILKASRKVNG